MPYKNPASPTAKAAQKAADRRLYYSPKGRLNTLRKRIRRAQKSWFLRKVRAEIGCKCGEHDWVVLDFHHRNPDEKKVPKDGNLEDLGWEDLLDEIEKCDVLCANCHRRETLHQRGGRVRKFFDSGERLDEC